MSTSAIHPPAPSSGVGRNGRFFRDLLATAMSYLKWGYGALLLSTIGYASYAAFKSLEKFSSFSSKDSVLPFAGFLVGSVLSALFGYWIGRAERKPKNNGFHGIAGTDS
jgi:hypothetical protein